MKTIKKSFAVFAAAFAVLFLAGLASCVPEANETPRIAANQINIFEITQNGASVAITALVPLQIGDVRTLSVEVLPADATDKAVMWSSSDASIVSIDAAGKLEAKASGNATITVSAGGAAATLAVSVAYSVTTETELRAMANNLAGYYVLKNDIPLMNEWTPLGTFTGTLDGAGFNITNLWINQPNEFIVGFIEENQGTVQNLGLELASQGISGGLERMGALVGFNSGAVSGRVSGTGKVSGRANLTGALVGVNRGTVIGYATVAVESTGGGGTGGLVGESNGSVVGYATGAVSGPIRVGGLVGTVIGGTVIGYARGAVAGTVKNDPGRNVNTIGGLIGNILTGTISGYARGAVSTDRVAFQGTRLGPAVGEGDGSATGGAGNIYYSGASGESTVTAPTGVTPNTLGTKVSVAAGDDEDALKAKFDTLTSSDWLFYTNRWPVINFPADKIFDDVRGDKQPVVP